MTSDQFNLVSENEDHDWVNLTDGTFETMLPLCAIGPERERGDTALKTHALGLTTNCDAYVYSFSRDDLISRISQLIDAYEDARELAVHGMEHEEVTENVELDNIKWTGTLKQSLKKNEEITFDETRIREVQYRPFTKLWLYEDPRILSSIKTISAMFPQNAVTPPPDSHLNTIQHHDLQHSRSRPNRRSQSSRNGSSLPLHPQTPAILITGTSNMTFQALATTTMPDLAMIAGSRQTRTIPRQFL